jgi:hypothetical protein
MNTPKGMQTDHINRNKLDNRKSNLRVCTASQNRMNQPTRGNSTSDYRGVYQPKDKNKWKSVIQHQNKRVFIGYFKEETHAALAYDLWAKELFEEFAQTNFISVSSQRS